LREICLYSDLLVAFIKSQDLPVDSVEKKTILIWAMPRHWAD
jgi:hypothetical protein